MKIHWHRFFKVGLRQLFSGSCFEVIDEFDLSDQVQRVDFAIIRRNDSNLPFPDVESLPDGLQRLRDHNLVTYKSMNEGFDRFALNEFIGHAVAYSKLQANDEWRNFSDELGLIVVSTRQPTTDVIKKLLISTDKEDLYQIDCIGWDVTCVVINRAPETDRNWLWELLHGDRSRWKSGSISAILEKITNKLKRMGIQDPEIEQFETEVIESWLDEIDLTKTSQGKVLLNKGREQGIEQGASVTATKIAEKLIDQGHSDLDVVELTELPIELIKKIRQRLSK